MSAWRRIALEMLPEFRVLIEDSESPIVLWESLWLPFVEAFRSSDFALVQRVFDYAEWCIETANDGHEDVSNAAFCSFYESIPLCQGLTTVLPRFLSRQRFLDLQNAFKMHTSEAEFAQLLASFQSKFKHA